jgi:alpha-D-ribose 1-methylphosphonate 5-phosphate C-P lyase
MDRDHVHLFTLVSSAGVRYPVYYVPDYGVICPDLATTNGNYRYLVSCVRDRYGIEPAEIAPFDCTEWGLLDAIRPWLEGVTGRVYARLGMTRIGV